MSILKFIFSLELKTILAFGSLFWVVYLAIFDPKRFDKFFKKPRLKRLPFTLNPLKIYLRVLKESSDNYIKPGWSYSWKYGVPAARNAYEQFVYMFVNTILGIGLFLLVVYLFFLLKK